VKIHDRLRSVGQRPVPVRATVLGLPTALLVTFKLPVTGPTTAGLNVTDRLQDLPSVSVAVQLPLVVEGDDGRGPEGLTAVVDRVAANP